jgi:hypothetical protein
MNGSLYFVLEEYTTTVQVRDFYSLIMRSYFARLTLAFP